MLKRIRRQIEFNRIGYSGEQIRKFAIHTGIGVIVVLILLCYIEIRKEAIAAACYEETLYKATAQGRWLKYGQYEPDTLYQKTIDKIPFLHYARISAVQSGNVNSNDNQTQVDMSSQEEYKRENAGEIHNTVYQKVEDENAQSARPNEEKEGGEQSNGSLLIHYAYGNIPPIEGAQAGQQGGQTGFYVGQQGQVQQSGIPWTVINNEYRSISTILSTVKEQYRWNDAAEQARFLKNYYIADVSVGNVNSIINGEKLLSIDTSLERISEEPQILIYHTHGTEGYSDSRNGVEADTVVGMGDILCEELTARGLSVIHDRTTYDYVNGKDNRNYAYTTARPQIEELLKEYPSIEVILDIHRDSGAARKATIDGKDTAQIMLFNGLCRNADGPISYLPNPYLDNTLAFSLQLNLLGRERYPGLMYKLYLKNYRYNMHFTGHCMLVELGTQNNTVEEAQNGVRYLAELLYELLTE